MPSYKDAFPSKWLKAEDCRPPLILEIKSVGFEDVGGGTGVKRMLVVRFAEREQGWVLNKTNGNLLEAMLGTDDYDKWVGARICLGSTRVQLRGEFVDGIRVQPVPTRKHRPLSAAAAVPPATPPTSPAVTAYAEEEQEGPDTEVGF